MCASSVVCPCAANSCSGSSIDKGSCCICESCTNGCHEG